jgi:hypothetical protein
MDSQHHAPDAAAMRQACDEALQHLLPRTTDPELTAITDPVPHFVPGMGTSGEWYRVGSLHLVATDRYLTVYLDAVTGKVQVEQAMMDVDSRAPVIPSVPMRRPGNALARDRWENEGGAI